jgi:hypothetical protein
MPERKLKRLVEVYFKGREVFIMRSYKSSFRKLGGLCRECDLSIFRLDEGARCLLWVEARDRDIRGRDIRCHFPFPPRSERPGVRYGWRPEKEDFLYVQREVYPRLFPY